jgi:hypothetical protein
MVRFELLGGTQEINLPGDIAPGAEMSIAADLYHLELHADPHFDPSGHRALLADGVEVENWAHSSTPELAAVVAYQARTGAVAAAVAASRAAAPDTMLRLLARSEAAVAAYRARTCATAAAVAASRAAAPDTESESEDSPVAAATTQADGGILYNPVDQAKTEHMDAERAAAGTVTAWDLCESLLRSPTAPRPSASAGGGLACERVVVAAGAHLRMGPAAVAPASIAPGASPGAGGAGGAWLAAWEAQFARLVAYKAAHGDCNVPVAWAEDLPLGRWVGVQRKNKKKMENGQPSDGMSVERVAKLTGLGLVWEMTGGGVVDDARWEAQLARLVAYKAVHGNCRVPKTWAEDPKLGGWVSMQRRYKKKMDGGEPSQGMTVERAARLTALGVVW